MSLKKNMETIIPTVFFEKPFWIGLFERFDNRKYEVCKITFGAQPKDFEVYECILHKWQELRFSPAILYKSERAKNKNPKRLQRETRNSLHNIGIGTKAQQALKLQHEQFNKERKIKSKEVKEVEKERQYVLRQERKKAKTREDKYLKE